MYCGSVPKMKPGFASLRNGDSNLQLYGNRWAGADPGLYNDQEICGSGVLMLHCFIVFRFHQAGLHNGTQRFTELSLWSPAALQPSLSLQMKRSYLWGGDDLQTDILPPPLDLEGNSDPLFKNQRHEEVDSATLETARLKDKLKRKMSESYSARGGKTNQYPEIMKIWGPHS